MLASNHPNSFLDGIIFATLFTQPVYSLARGDVFKTGFIRRLFRSLKLLPVYRTSEGLQNLGSNYTTFSACKDIFRKEGIVVIFSEGKCVNEWHLRPLKKGTARLAISSWDESIPLQVIPVGINYSSFRRFGKNIFINFGEPIDRSVVDNYIGDGAKHREFNTLLEEQLKSLVFEAPKKDLSRQKKLLELPPSRMRRGLLFLPAIAGWILHFPVYMPLRDFTLHKTSHNDHFDSVLTGVLFFVYPLYLLFITALLFYFTQNPFSFLCLILLPFTAWAYVQVKGQMDRIIENGELRMEN